MVQENINTYVSQIRRENLHGIVAACAITPVFAAIAAWPTASVFMRAGSGLLAMTGLTLAFVGIVHRRQDSTPAEMLRRTADMPWWPAIMVGAGLIVFSLGRGSSNMAFSLGLCGWMLSIELRRRTQAKAILSNMA